MQLLRTNTKEVEAHAASFAKTKQNTLKDCLSVYGVRNRLPDAHILQRRVLFQVEEQEHAPFAGRGADLKRSQTWAKPYRRRPTISLDSGEA
jgi:hypothetical protein